MSFEMEYPMQVQGNMVGNKMTISKFHGIPWNSMERGDSPFGGTRVPWNFVYLHVPWNFRSFMDSMELLK